MNNLEDNLEDDLEKELLNYNEMSSSIEKIKNSSAQNKDLFKDLDIFSSIKNLNKTSNNNNKTFNDNKNFNVNNFVQDLENNLDNFDSVDKNIEPIASNYNFNKINDNFTEKIINFEDDDNEDSNNNINYNKELKKGYENWNNKIYDLLINIKEPLIIILLFILLNNIDFIVLINTLPFIHKIDSPYPSLIIRGIIFASIIYYLRKF